MSPLIQGPWILWAGLFIGRLRDPKPQGQALYWAWSLVNSQLEWVPGKKGDEMVSDSGSQPLDTGSLHLMAKWPDTQTLSLQHCGQKLDVGSQLLGDLFCSWLHGYYFWAPEQVT